MAVALTLVPSGGVPITPIAAGAAPYTVVQSGGIAATVVASGGRPVTLLTPTDTAYDTDTIALLGTMSVQPTATRAGLIDALIAGLKTDGVWSLLDLFYVLAAHDAQAARLNWLNPATFACAEVNSPTFTADQGYAGNGANSYLNTTFVPSTSATKAAQNSATIFSWSRTSAVTAGGGMIGPGTGTFAMNLVPRNTGDLFAYRINQTTTTSVANTDGSGLFAASRSGASATQSYRNGSTIGSAGSVASAALPSVALNIGRVGGGFSSVQVAAAGLGANLNGTQHAALNTRLNTYMTAIGAA